MPKQRQPAATPPAATADQNPNSKSKTASKPSSMNPNWAQLQAKLRSRNPKPKSTTLGKRKDRQQPSPPPPPRKESAVVSGSAGLTPTSDDCSVTKTLAMDCEMVGVSTEGTRSALARVSLVNTWGNVVYDEYVRPIEHIVDFRTSISGIRPKHMKKAKEFWAVQKEVYQLIKGCVLIGHALHHDLKALLLSHPKKDIRDTSEYELFRRNGRRRSLKGLAAEFLGVKIQQNEHCPIEDARAAMFVYNKHKREWEKNLKEKLRFRRKMKSTPKKKLYGDAEAVAATVMT